MQRVGELMEAKSTSVKGASCAVLAPEGCTLPHSPTHNPTLGAGLPIRPLASLMASSVRALVGSEPGAGSIQGKIHPSAENIVGLISCMSP